MTFVKTKRGNDFFPNVLGNLVDEFLSDEVNPFIQKTMVNRFPAANIIERETSYEIQLIAPGRSKENFDISVEKDILTISDNKEYKTDESIKFKKKEFSIAAFKRSFTLSEKVDQNKISASYEDGILKLTIAKREEEVIPTRKIAVS